MRWDTGLAAGLQVACLSMAERLGMEPLLECLSGPEADAAQAIQDAGDRHHFILRRSFQRLFVAEVCAWKGALPDLPLFHSRDQRSRCDAAPDMIFSFSSSRTVFCAAAALRRAVGIDVEIIREVENPLALAKRFFAAEEVALLSSVPATEQNLQFLRLWTVKEAGLKAQGIGIVAGFERVPVEMKGSTLRIPNQGQDGWDLYYPSLAQNCVIAVVHRQFTGH